MIDFVGRRRLYAVFSLLMIIPSLIGLAIWQFEAGLDFAGGLETEVRFLGDTELADLQEAQWTRGLRRRRRRRRFRFARVRTERL